MKKHAAVVAIVALALAGCGSEEPPEDSQTSVASMATQTIQPSFAFDLWDQPLLAGVSDNIFVGTVVSQVGSKSLSDIPLTQFEVEIAGNLKGELTGSVVVNQTAGIDPISNEFVIFEGDTPVEVGKSYLFSTGYSQEDDWHTMTVVVGHIELSSAEVQAFKEGPRARNRQSSPEIERMQESIAAQRNPFGGEPAPGLKLPASVPTATPTTTPEKATPTVTPDSGGEETSTSRPSTEISPEDARPTPTSDSEVPGR